MVKELKGIDKMSSFWITFTRWDMNKWKLLSLGRVNTELSLSNRGLFLTRPDLSTNFSHCKQKVHARLNFSGGISTSSLKVVTASSNARVRSSKGRFYGNPNTRFTIFNQSFGQRSGLHDFSMLAAMIDPRGITSILDKGAILDLSLTVGSDSGLDAVATEIFDLYLDSVAVLAIGKTGSGILVALALPLPLNTSISR
jgi:hypothetical protein